MSWLDNPGLAIIAGPRWRDKPDALNGRLPILLVKMTGQRCVGGGLLSGFGLGGAVVLILLAGVAFPTAVLRALATITSIRPDTERGVYITRSLSATLVISR